GRQRRRVGRVIKNVQACESHPHIHTGLTHAMVVIKLQPSTYIAAALGPFVGISPSCTRLDEEFCSGDLAIVRRSRMISMMVHGQRSGDRVEIVGESDVSNLPGRSADRETRICSSVG